MKKELKKKNIYTMFTTAVALFALVTATVAWFVTNRNLDVLDMRAEMQVSPNLVIAKTKEEVMAIDEPFDYFSVTFTEIPYRLSPCRHDYYGEYISPKGFSTGLHYNSNPNEMDAETGLAQRGRTILRKPVPVFGGAQADRYYLDYEVSIASAGMAMEHQDLKVTISQNTEEGVTYPEVFKSASIDFYVDSTDTEDNYMGTLNLAGYDSEINNASTRRTSLNILKDYTIPHNKEDSIRIIMRCYFDGGLLKDSTHAYVATNTVVPDALDINVKFVAEPHID